MKHNPRASIKRQVSQHRDATENFEGGLAFKLTPKMELLLRSATTMFGEKKFYESVSRTARAAYTNLTGLELPAHLTATNEDRISKLVDIVSKEDAEFAPRLAAFCRNELYLRSLPVALLVHSCRTESKKHVRKYTPHVVKRADELAEVVAFYKTLNGDIGNKLKKGMLCNPLKRGLADTFHNFNEYQLAKYDRDGEVKLRDVMRIVHPTPVNDEESALFKRVLERKLQVPGTWEVLISSGGSTKENWEKVLPKMPFMARLRNIRNLLEKKVDITPVIKMLTDEKQVKRSRQLPFRFYSAYREIENWGGDSKQKNKVLEALETALELSVANLPKLGGDTAIFVDSSGSMTGRISEKSSVSIKEVAMLFGAMAHFFSDNAVLRVYGTETATINVLKKDSILTNMQKALRTDVGGSTEAWKAFKWLNTSKEGFDRIIVITDEQCYNTEDDDDVVQEWRKYKSSGIAPNAKLYVINVKSYGTASFPEDEMDVSLIGGWSERVLDYIKLYENKNAMLQAVEKYEVGTDENETEAENP